MLVIDYELIIKIIALFVGLFGSIYQLRNLRLTFRSSLKTDLDILKMLQEDDPNYSIVKNSINESIKKIYGVSNKNGLKIHSPGDFIFGILFLSGFSFWTYYLVRHDHLFWSYVTGFFAFAGLGGIMNGLDKKKDNN
ncbi:MAG: hypothetical protein JWN78_2256 [Bacteroidota bacterium]|nr:hypothetical protein [Bacteroidota bacterium]